jgi:hypothetical protein
LIEVTAHVKFCGGPAFAFGGVLLIETVVVAVDVHPFVGLVTVIVYVPAAFTVGVHVVPPAATPGPVQLQVVPPVAEEPERLVDNVVQVSVPGAPAFEFGGKLLAKTVIVSVAAQPPAVTENE